MRSTGEISQILQKAEQYCAQNKLRLTEGRSSVLEQVTRSRKPVKAYDLISRTALNGKKPMPPVIYRALDFWVEHGFIHRIDTLNAYTSCTHPGCEHECQIFTCKKCERVSEICNPDSRLNIEQHACELGFDIHHIKIEVTGVCPDCR